MESFRTKENLRSIYTEAFGERKDHPLLARILAFVVDYGLFFLSGLAIYFALESVDNASTVIYLLINIPLWTTYFTLGNSRICRGQTLGKKFLRIRVVDIQSNYLGLVKALIRSIPVVLLMNSHEIMRFIITKQSNLFLPGFITLTTILLGTIYFPLAKLDRQSLHDMLVRSYVIPKDRVVKMENRTEWVLIVIFVVILIATVTLMLEEKRD